VVARHPYKGFVIEVWLYKHEKSGYRAWPYIEKTHGDGDVKIVTKKHFPFSDANYFGVEIALKAAVKEGQKQIDAGFDVERIA